MTQVLNEKRCESRDLVYRAVVCKLKQGQIEMPPFVLGCHTMRCQESFENTVPPLGERSGVMIERHASFHLDLVLLVQLFDNLCN